EQATSVLDEETAAPVELLSALDGAADLDAPPIPASLSQHLAIKPDAPVVGARPTATDGAVATPSGARTPTLSVVPAPAVTAVDVPLQAAGSEALVAAGAPLAAVVGAASVDRVASAPAVSPAAATEGGGKDPLWFLSQEPEPKGATQPTGTAVPPKAIL